MQQGDLGWTQESEVMEGSRARREWPWDTGVKVTQSCLTVGKDLGPPRARFHPWRDYMRAATCLEFRAQLIQKTLGSHSKIKQSSDQIC